MWRIDRGHLAIAAVCLVLGFMLSTNYKAQRRLVASVSFTRDSEAAARLDDAERQRDAAQAEVLKLRQRLDDLSKREATYEDLTKELADMEESAGLTPLTGPGVTVMMEESQASVRPGENPYAFTIHDVDVLQVINELIAGGAEALNIDGQRYTGRTEVRRVGPTLVVNGVSTVPPVRIETIGNPDVLEAAINLRGGVATQLAAWGIRVTVRKEKAVSVPAYKGTLHFSFAKPVPGG